MLNIPPKRNSFTCVNSSCSPCTCLCAKQMSEWACALTTSHDELFKPSSWARLNKPFMQIQPPNFNRQMNFAQIGFYMIFYCPRKQHLEKNFVYASKFPSNPLNIFTYASLLNFISFPQFSQVTYILRWVPLFRRGLC